MISRRTTLKIRKAHRYLGLFLGVQFLFWTLSGLYFSWTAIDEIHGDHFRSTTYSPPRFTELIPPGDSGISEVFSIELRAIGGAPYYWINNSTLLDARSGEVRQGITADEARLIAQDHMRRDLQITQVKHIHEVGPHHEYRGKPLPAYEITYQHPDELKAYVSEQDGKFQTVRHRSWRWFDFLWMTHTMDYQGRDDFNTLVLRGFSLLGLITVLSGFTLWATTSPRFRGAFRFLALKK